MIIILKKPLKKLINYIFSTNKKIIFVSLLSLVSISIFFYSLINTYEFSNNVAGYLIVIMTLIAILFYLFRQKIESGSNGRTAPLFGDTLPASGVKGQVFFLKE